MTAQMDIIRALAEGSTPYGILQLAAQAVLMAGEKPAPLLLTTPMLAAEPGSASLPRRGRRPGSTTPNAEASWADLDGEPLRFTMSQLRDRHGVSATVVGEQRRVIHFLRAYSTPVNGMTWAAALYTAKRLGFHAK